MKRAWGSLASQKARAREIRRLPDRLRRVDRRANEARRSEALLGARARHRGVVEDRAVAPDVVEADVVERRRA